MNLQKIYTASLTAELAAAERWYTKLLSRGPDNRPMGTLVQWELFDQAGLRDPDGNLLTLATPPSWPFPRA